MKLDDMKVHAANRTTLDSVSGFRVETKEPEELVVKSAGIAVKIGLCVAALLVAFVIRIVSNEPEKVAEVSKMLQSDTESEETAEELGSLRFVDAANIKWSAPVRTNDVELLRDHQLVRFTAASETVSSCISGKVVMIEQDERYGTFLRIQSDDGIETVLYGFESVSVKSGDHVAANDLLGTVPVGRSVYLAVERNGAPLDPSEYVDLSIENAHATL